MPADRLYPNEAPSVRDFRSGEARGDGQIMRLPNVVIAGAPRCGTTSLFRWVAAHPGVVSSRTKETRYLVDPGYPLYNAKSNFRTGGLEGYAQLFPQAESPDSLVCIEATPDYMYQHLALSVLKDLPSSPLIVFLLRNPVERVLSLFGYAMNNVGSLKRNLSAREFFTSARDGVNTGDEIIDSAVAHSVYHIWITKWIEAVGKARVLVYFFDELTNNPRSIMEDFCRRLRLDPSIYRGYTFTAENPTVQVRSVSLSRAKRAVELHLPDLMRSAVLKSVYQAVNVRGKVMGPGYDEGLKREMQDYFAEPNRKLAEILARELPSGWL